MTPRGASQGLKQMKRALNVSAHWPLVIDVIYFNHAEEFVLQTLLSSSQSASFWLTSLNIYLP